MSEYDLKEKKNNNYPKNIELSRLRLKILDAIRFSERYWMIFKEQTFGVATILDLKYKRLYIEVLFFTNRDVMERGVPLLKIYNPVGTQFDFNEVLVDPDFDEDGLVSPEKIIERINDHIEKEVKYHLSILDNEVQLINDEFENYPIEENPYYRKIRIYLPELLVKLKINLENYPLAPRLSEKNQLVTEKFIQTYRAKLKELLRERLRGEIKQRADKLKIIRETFTINTDIIKNWKAENPPHINQVVKSLLDIKKESQHFLLNNISIGSELKNITFKIHRGQSIGIIYSSTQSSLPIKNSAITKLFEAIAGKSADYSGEIIVFGKKKKLETKRKKNNRKNGIFIASLVLSTKIESMTVKKATQYDIKIKPKWKIRRRILINPSKSAKFLIRMDEIVSLPPKYKTRKSFINSALKVTGLLNRKSEKISELSPVERLLFSISRILLKSPNVIMFSLSPGELEQVEIEKFNTCIEKIKRKFHVILIIHGPEGIVSNCDQILTIIDKEAEIFSSINDFISKMPEKGEIITVELTNPNQDALKKMFKIKSAIFIEERKNEKYKIFCKENPDKIIIKLMQIIGQKVYNIKRYKASLTEYLEYLKLIKENY